MGIRKRGRAAAASGSGGQGGSGGGGRGGNFDIEKCRGMEANTMIILDTSKSATLHHLIDDRHAFLEAVWSASLVPEDGTAPTNKMLEAIFQLLKDEDSLSLIIESYQLLNELDKRYPRVCFSGTEESESSSSSKFVFEVMVVKRVISSPV